MPPGTRSQVGLFGPETLTWRVNRELVLLAGGGSALLLQVAHPLVAAGVEQHSDYATHPWARLHRTLDTTTMIVFGDPRASAAAGRRLQGVHARVSGVSDEGAPYDARDPRLLLWVWATLVHTAIDVYGRCVGALTPDELECYYEEQKRFAQACGVPLASCPETHADFEAYWERMRERELRVTPAARAVAESIVHPRVPRPLRPAFAPNTLLTAGLLPPSLRAAYGFAWSARHERLLAITLAALRGARRRLPAGAREFPAARAARRRAAAPPGGR